MFGYAAFAQPTFGGLGAPPTVAYFVSATEVLTSADSTTGVPTFVGAVLENININLQSVTPPAVFGGVPFGGVPFGGTGFGGQLGNAAFISIPDASVTWSLGGAVTENINFADTPDGIKVQNSAIVEGQTLADSNSVIANFVSSVTENNTFAEASSVLTSFVSSILENLSSADAPTALAAFISAISEPIYSTTDSQTSIGAFAPKATEPLSLLDSITFTYLVSIVEAIITEIDSEAVIVSFASTIAEAMSVGDAQTVIQIFNATSIETLSAQDGSSVVSNYHMSQIENITAADVLLMAAWIKINNTESTQWVLIDNRQ